MKTTRNLWPIGIAAAFFLFFAGTVCLVILASSQKMDLVSGDYYEQELRYQHRLDEIERARHLKASVSYEAAGKRIAVSLPVEHARLNATGRIQLYRPSAAGMDREFKLELNERGIQFLDIRDFRKGLWKIRVFWTVAGEDYLIDQTVVLGT